MIHRAICRRSALWLSRRPLGRPFSSEARSDQVQFTYALANTSRDAISSMMDDIASKALSANSSSHDAAVVLATPEFAKNFENADFMGSLASLLAGSSRPDKFHVLGAIVDSIAPPLGSYHTTPGISVLRGHLDHMLPHLWQPEPPRSPEDKEAVSALSFSLGVPKVTLPLARTTFQNNRASTLLASTFDLSGDGSRMERQMERYAQEVLVSDSELPRKMGDLGLWAPLVPVTPPRLVAASFGNIVRGVEIDGQTIPASTELEDAVNAFYGKRGSSAMNTGPAGIWALITPKSGSADAAASWLNGSPTPLSVDTSESSMQELAAKTAIYLHCSHQRGAKLLQVLSGGGGWGAKKGLLSLDPQRTHFSLSEEEEMHRFAQSMSESTFAPTGCTVQFLMALDDVPAMPVYLPPSIVFGVPGTHQELSTRPETPFMGGHFGALSSKGIFVEAPSERDDAEFPDERKLSVPNSRLFMAEGIDERMKGVGKMPTFAEAGLMALLL
ncbi:hypothetical protein CCM_06388 [Cordyceps militaris CM01]|uniref:Uncharacterized protein n=1 Tax=Cordyceps militaris (strain CM01) TaxID=983644 RepID=G3JKE9_CORMM|nr:uncharacterized protein CCM_06388 [Cordyceps militaris CM01]EGX92227.1 hypothetical protein CCM_06388 [Cordyceps militaris CM01]